MRRLLLAIAAVLLAASLFALIVWWLPARLSPPVPALPTGELGRRGVTGVQLVQLEDDRLKLQNDRLKLQNDTRGTLLQVLGGSVLLLGLIFTWLQLRATREGQITDRYTKAVDQLGNSKLAVRLGGIYALQRIARDSAGDRLTISEVLCHYARTTERPPFAEEAGESRMLDGRAPDIHAALAIVGHWRERVGRGRHWLDLHGADFRGAKLENARLRDVYFYDAQLQAARLIGAELQNAQLDRADLRGADLGGADLTDAHLFDAKLEGAKADEDTVWPPYWTVRQRRQEAGILEPPEIDETTEIVGLAGSDPSPT